MKKSTIVFSILGVLVLTGGLATGLILVRQNQNIAEKAAPATSVFVTPGSQSKNPGDNFTFSVDISTGANNVTAIDIRMTFNPAAVKILSLEKGSGAAGLDASISDVFDNTAGTITYSIYTLNTANALNGSSIEVLKVNATVLPGAAAGDYNLGFDPATSAAAALEGQNVIISRTQGILTVGGASGSPSPTPSGSESPTPSPTPSTSPTPGGTATPAPTPTPSGTGSTSSVKVSSPSSGSTVSDTTPTFKGTAPAGSTVTITIYSTPVTATVTADANGNWQYTPTQALADGSHTVTITASGTTNTATSSFTVQTGGAQLPVTGVEWPTVAAGALGVFVIIGSLLLAI